MPSNFDSKYDLCRAIERLIPTLNEAELVLLLQVGKRLKMGQERHGFMKIDDGRDLSLEMHEEMLDGVVYAAQKSLLFRLLTEHKGDMAAMAEEAKGYNPPP